MPSAYLKEQVIICDLVSDPRWPPESRELARSYGVRAAWSEPLLSKDGDVLGTFGMYYPEPRTPDSSEQELIKAAGNIARIAIERDRSQLELAKALSELRKTEIHLLKIIDSIPALAWVASSDASAEFFNRGWLDYTGLAHEQALNWGWKAAVHRDDLPRMLETFHEAVSSGKSFETEGRLRRHDGEFRWFLFRGNPLLDGSGRVVKWYRTNTDIEDRKRAEDDRPLLDVRRMLVSSSADDTESVQVRIARAMSAGPPEVATSARIVDTDAQGKTIVLREGNNGFTCMPGNPKRVGDPPMCADAASMQWAADFKVRKPKPTNTVPGIIYMLAGATQRSDSDPYDTTSPPITVPPHWMIMWPFDPQVTGLPVTHRDTGAYIMWAGSPYAHLHVMGRP